MPNGLQYRFLSLGGTFVITILAIAVANHPLPHHLVTGVIPGFSQSPTTILTGPDLWAPALLVETILLVALTPLYNPTPRRRINAGFRAANRVLLSGIIITMTGYFDLTFRLPPLILAILFVMLIATIPAWFALIQRPWSTSSRLLIVGDDPQQIDTIRTAAEMNVVGYLSAERRTDTGTPDGLHAEDGGHATPTKQPPIQDRLPHLGTLEALDDTLATEAVDTVALAFRHPKRHTFFNVLHTCFHRGIDAKTHRSNAHYALTTDESGPESLVDVAIEPWGWRAYASKRLFDIVFAVTGLLLLLPVILVIAGGIALTDGRPILYRQERTAIFGTTFTLHKFRTMIPAAETTTGAVLSDADAGGVDPRVTRWGQILRETHLDEIPQLVSVLRGDMSVVGPRPERPELEADIQTDIKEWPKRWFVKPGLTGLAQVNGVSSHDPELKLQYDLHYIHNRSFLMDIHIVSRQIYLVFLHSYSLLRETLKS